MNVLGKHQFKKKKEYNDTQNSTGSNQCQVQVGTEKIVYVQKDISRLLSWSRILFFHIFAL